MFHWSNIGTESATTGTTGISISQRANPTLQDLMGYAAKKSREMSSAKFIPLVNVVRQNRFVANVNAALMLYSLSTTVSSLEPAVLTSLQAELPSCPSEDLSDELPSLQAELPSCPSEDLSDELPSLQAESPSHKVSRMEMITEADEDVLPEEEFVDETWIEQNTTTEDDDAIFDRLIREYDEEEELYQRYNKYGHSNENINTCLGMPVDPQEDLFCEECW